MTEIIDKGKTGQIPTLRGICFSSFRFFFALTLALTTNFFTHDPRITGTAAIVCFLSLMIDQRSDLSGRLIGNCLLAVTIVASCWVGMLVGGHPYGKWLLLFCACVGVSMLPFAEKYWWLLGKTSIVMFMVCVFDFQPNEKSLIGFGIGFVISTITMILDSLIWKEKNLGARPLEQFAALLKDNKNPLAFSVISASCLALCMSSADLIFKVMEPAWVGIAFVYLINKNFSAGFLMALKRLGGAFIGFLICLVLVPLTSHHPLLLGFLIVLSASCVPLFIVKKFFVAYTFITVFILLAIDWMTQSFGGDGSLLAWRFLDTCYGILWALILLIIADFQGFVSGVKGLFQRKSR